jgi:MFS family permease
VGNSSDSVWYTQTIAIFTAILGIPVSQAADLWGRKILLVTLTSSGFVGTLIIAGASSSSTAIAGFAVTGISYGAQPLLHAIVSEVFARKYRPWAQGSVNVVASLGAIVGLLVGGAVTRNENHDGFRAYWYIVAGMYAFATITVQLLYSPPPRALQLVCTLREKLRRLDWVGYGLLTPALVLFCMFLAWLQNPYPWTDSHVLAPFVVGICLAIALVAYEIMVKKDGMFHHRLFQDRNFPLALGCVFAEGMVFFCANDYFGFQVSVFFSDDSLATGAHYYIAFLSLGVSAILSGLWCSRTKAVRVPTITAFSSFVLFNILMATTSETTTPSQIWAFPIILGFGLGTCLPALVTAAHFATPQELVAITSGLMISLRSLGGSVGLAVYNTIFHHGFSSNLGPKTTSAVLPLGLSQKELPQLISALVSHNETAIQQFHGMSPRIIEAGYNGLLSAYRIGFRGVWVTTACLSLVAGMGK